jgi:hypothetical protein
MSEEQVIIIIMIDLISIKKIHSGYISSFFISGSFSDNMTGQILGYYPVAIRAMQPLR